MIFNNDIPERLSCRLLTFGSICPQSIGMNLSCERKYPERKAASADIEEHWRGQRARMGDRAIGMYAASVGHSSRRCSRFHEWRARKKPAVGQLVPVDSDNCERPAGDQRAK
ncbi:hypothetical protein KM043_003677 [Ampulex compressa]|nr:hypothetical protein KM043_003677 [Ampulex compressa]